MSTTYIGAALRRRVIARAQNLCEYCLLHEDDTFFGCHVDHVISEKHGGATESGNLAYSCTFCNLHKGSDIGSLSSQSVLVPFFSPRTDAWAEHFALNGDRIEPLSAQGEATANILQFNNADRLLERQSLIAADKYPCQAALDLLRV